MAQEDPSESFLTVAEVAKTLKLNQQTVRNMIDRGELQAVRVGQRRVRVRRSALEEFIVAGEMAGTQPDSESERGEPGDRGRPGLRWRSRAPR